MVCEHMFIMAKDIKGINRMRDIHICSEFTEQKQEFVHLKCDGDYVSAIFLPGIIILSMLQP